MSGGEERLEDLFDMGRGDTLAVVFHLDLHLLAVADVFIRESDEQAVKIITMHKAKGLEYNIAICPYLDMKADTDRATGAFRDEDGEYYVMDMKLMSDALRQMYV